MITKEISILASAARTAGGNTQTAPIEVGQFKEAAFFLDTSAVTGTNPTFDLKIQTQDPIAGTWHTIIQFAQVTAAANSRLTVTNNLGTKLSAVWTIGGTDTPTFTSSLSVILKAES